MATNTERTIYVIELKDRFTKGMSKATKSADKFNKATDRVRSKTNSMSAGFAKLGNAAKLGFAAAIAGMTALGVSAVRTAAKFEGVEKALEIMTGRKGLGKDLMTWAKEFSRTTVITFDQTVTSMRKLLAYGVSSANVKPLTALLSEIAAGVGTDRLPYLTLALGQVKSRGRLFGTELRQFREHGVDIVSEVAKGLTKATGKLVGTKTVEEMVTKGLISFDMVVAAMEGMVGPGGRFNKMLEEMAKTTTGRFNILKSSWSIAMAEIGNAMLPIVNRILSFITPKIEKLARLNFDNVGNTLSRFVDSMAKVKGLFTTKSVFRIIYEELVIFLFNMTDITDKLVTEFSILKNNFLSPLSNFFTNLFKGIEADLSGDTELGKKFTRAAFDSFGADDGFAQKARDASAIRIWKNQTDMWRQLAQKPGAAAALDTGVFTPGGGVDPMAGSTGGAKKQRTNRQVGTGARDIIINIGNLIENVTNNNSHYDKNVEAMNEQLRRALLTVVNDVSLMAE
jgi:tape measure domain-containing protein